VGNTPAPKGHYILDVFNQIRTGGDSNVSTSKRPSVLGFYAGRAWFAGIPDHQYTGDVFFSPVLTDLTKIGNCYQEYDPTAEDLNALLATDGGKIHIADLGTVYDAKAIGQDYVLFSSNGVWAISGGDARGNFKADDFSIRKITDQGTIARDSVVVAEGAAFWWGEGGIWSMSGSQVDESLTVNRITRETIQSFYDDIDAPNRAYARGHYDSFEKKVYWLYNDTQGYDAINFRFRYNRILILDLSLGAFYTYTISDLDDNSPWISDMSLKTPGSESIIVYDIFQDEDDVVEADDDIVQDVAFEAFASVKLKFLTVVQNVDTTYSYTFSEFKDTSFHDWATWDAQVNNISNEGANYESAIQTGWNSFDDLIREKTITHLTSFFNRTESGFAETEEEGVVEFTDPSGALIQVRWEFTDQDNNRWTTPSQAYRLRQSYIPEDALDPFNYSYTVVSSKHRMRGRGTSFSVRYLSEEGKDMQLIGFAVNVRAGAKP
jgi:hypothetical protein